MKRFLIALLIVSTLFCLFALSSCNKKDNKSGGEGHGLSVESELKEEDIPEFGFTNLE